MKLKFFQQGRATLAIGLIALTVSIVIPSTLRKGDLNAGSEEYSPTPVVSTPTTALATMDATSDQNPWEAAGVTQEVYTTIMHTDKNGVADTVPEELQQTFFDGFKSGELSYDSKTGDIINKEGYIWTFGMSPVDTDKDTKYKDGFLAYKSMTTKSGVTIRVKFGPNGIYKNLYFSKNPKTGDVLIYDTFEAYEKAEGRYLDAGTIVDINLLEKYDINNSNSNYVETVFVYPGNVPGLAIGKQVYTTPNHNVLWSLRSYQPTIYGGGVAASSAIEVGLYEAIKNLSFEEIQKVNPNTLSGSYEILSESQSPNYANLVVVPNNN